MKLTTTILTLAFVAPVFAHPITVTDSTVSGNQHHLVEREDENRHHTLHTIATVAKYGLEAAEILARGVAERGYEISAFRSLPHRSVDNDFDRRDPDRLDARNLDNKLEVRGSDGLEAREIDDGLEARYF
ncbi:hypothetical protein APHAL10511_003046 [Amanita phalloides]|nr:hypothetical protein APHAL10511_003046 [Amanita phalloides]